MRLEQIMRQMLLVGWFLISGLGLFSVGVAEASGSGEPAAHGEIGQADHGLNWFDVTNRDRPAIIALLFNFTCLVVILYFILRKPLSARFLNRKVDLENAIREAEEMKSRAEKALAEARARSEQLDAEMGRLRTEMIEAGKAQSAQIAEDANRQAKRAREDARVMVEQEVTRMAQAIREEIVTEMVKLAEARIREKINESDHSRIAREYLEGMSPRSIPPAGRPSGD